MREREEWLIVTFPSTAAAMAMERQAKRASLPGRIIPTPTVVTAACGLAWMARTEDRAAVERMLEDEKLQFESILVLML